MLAMLKRIFSSMLPNPLAVRFALRLWPLYLASSLFFFGFALLLDAAMIAGQREEQTKRENKRIQDEAEHKKWLQGEFRAMRLRMAPPLGSELPEIKQPGHEK